MRNLSLYLIAVTILNLQAEDQTYLLCKQSGGELYGKIYSEDYDSEERLFHLYIKFNQNSFIKRKDSHREYGKAEGRSVSKRTNSDGTVEYILTQYAEHSALRDDDNYEFKFQRWPGNKRCLYSEGGNDGIVSYADCNGAYYEFDVSRVNFTWSKGSSKSGYQKGICELISSEQYSNDFIPWIEIAKDQNIKNKEIEEKIKTEKQKKIKF
jgi:hypothetical protein